MSDKDFTNVLGLLKYILMYYGLVFLAKEAVWEKLSEIGKDRFDMLSGIGFASTIFLYNKIDIFSIFQGSLMKIIIDNFVSFLFAILCGYIIGKSFISRRKRKNQ